MKNKKWLIILSSFILIILGLFISIKIDDKNFNKNAVKYNTDYLFKVTYLTIDSAKTTEDTKMKDLKSENILSFINSVVPLEKKGDYLYAKLSDFANKIAFENINDYVFTIHDLSGTEIEGCEFDKETTEIKIPYHYYKNKTQEIPIQMEIQSRHSKKNMKNIKINTAIKNVFVLEKEITQNAILPTTTINISNSKKINLTKENIKIYLNNQSEYIKNDDFEFDSKTGSISIDYPSYLINKISVKINDSFINKLLNITKVSALTSDEWEKIGDEQMGGYKVTTIPKINAGESYTVTVGENIFGYTAQDPHDSADWNKAYYYNAISCGDGCPDGTKINLDNGSHYYGAVQLAALNNSKYNLVFPNEIVGLLCTQHSEVGNTCTNESLDFTVTALTDPFEDDGPMSQVFSIVSKPHCEQIMAVAIKIYWEESKGYIEIQKNYDPADSSREGTETFTAYTTSNGNCTTTQVGTSIWDSDKKKYYIGYSGGKASLDVGKTYCVKETSGGSQIVTYSSTTNDGFGKVTLDDTSNSNAGLKYKTLTVTNKSLKIKFAKEDSETGQRLSGAGFTIYKKGSSTPINFENIDSNKCYKMTTANTQKTILYSDLGINNGQICLSNVEAGATYVIKETVVPYGYQQMKDMEITAPTISGSTEVTATYKNTPLRIEFTKKDSETKKSMPEAGFTIFKEGSDVPIHFENKYKGCYKENSNGPKVQLSLDPNENNGYICLNYVEAGKTYIIRETYVPEGYYKMPDMKITVPAKGSTEVKVTKVYEDTPIKIKFYKEDPETGKRINEAGFTIYKNGSSEPVHFEEKDENGCYKETTVKTNRTQLFTNTSENEGVVCLNYVTSGAKYKLVETSIPKGYLKMPDKEIVASKNTDTVNLTPVGIINTPLEIRFYKEDSETGKRINKAGFTIYKDGSAKPLTFDPVEDNCYKENANGEGSKTELFTDTGINDGEVCLRYVTEGATYKVTETTTPNGYQTMPDKEIKAQKNTGTVNLTNAILKETPLYMYFSKEDSDKSDIPIIGAEFEVYKYNKDTKKYDLVKFTNEENDSEDCYIESTNGITKLYSKNITIKSIEEDGTPINKPVSGGVCLKYVSADTMYKVVETNPIDRYTFFRPEGEESGIKMKVNHQGAQTNYNLDETARGDSKMKNYPTMLEFEKKASDDAEGKDSTITQLIDGALFEIVNKDGTVMTFEDKGNGLYEYSASGTVTRVHTTNRKFIVKYLPWGEYNVREVEESSPNGYYYNPDLSKFTITKYTNGQVEKMDQAKANIIDKPVEITFTKTDIYNYYSAEDKAKLNSEEKLFDTAKFVIKDSNGNILKLKYVGKTEEDGNIYRYIPVDSNNTKEKINTYKGKLKITHLMNNTTYVIEEVESMEGFILPNDHPKKTYEIKRKEPNSKTDSSITQVIENVPTKVKIEKRDLKTGYLIDDDKVTFELYKKDASGKLTRIYVNERQWLHDATGNTEYSYTYSKLNKKTDVRITTLNGAIVIRYLPKGNYVLKETESPEGYDLPVGEGAKTYFDVSGETTEVDTEVVKNKPSKIIIRKYSEDGYLITGAKFKIYKVTNYDPNLSAKNQEKELIKLKTIRQGEYENKDVRDTEEITTCEENCEIIGEETKEAGIIKAGELIVQYLETENYYVIEETEAPEGYQLPENPYNIVYLKESVEDVDAEVVIENEYTPVTFYKYDEYNKLLDGAEYKLQKLNSNKKYEDINVSKMEGKEGSVYAVDYNSKSSVVTTTNGSATIYMLTAGQYRVVETKAPEGYELPKASVNVATFFVTDEGKTKGDFIIANKKPTTKQMVLNKANSELVINIQTGQKVMKYIGIIVALLTGIGILMFIIHKMNKKA